MGKVIISNNPIHTSERIDFNGNIIDPRTKQILVPKEEEYVPPTPTPPPTTPPEATITPPVNPIAKDDPMDIQAQIVQAEANLVKLKEVKKVKIEEMEKLLNELKK